eukprot:gene28550-37508_t
MSTLMEAARDGNLESVVSLLQLAENDNIDMRDMYGMTSLLWASLHGHVAIVQKLLDSGADVYATNEFKITAIELARQYDHDIVAHILDVWTKQKEVQSKLQEEIRKRMVLEDERISNIAAIKNLEQIIAADNIGRSTLYEQQAVAAAAEIHRLKNVNISYYNQLSSAKDEATHLRTVLQKIQNDLFVDLSKLRKEMIFGGERFAELKVTMQQDSDSWRAEAKDFEHRVEELIARQSASATARAQSVAENGRLAGENEALRVHVSQREDSLAQLETQITEDKKQQALSALLIQRLQDEISSLRIQESGWKCRTAELEAKVEVDVAKISVLLAAEEVLQKTLSERKLEQAAVVTENGRLVEEINALRVQISQLDDVVAQLKAQIVVDAKHAEEYQAFSDLQIHHLQNENSSLCVQVSTSEDRAAKLEEKMAVDATTTAALMVNIDELRHEVESLTCSSIKDKEAMKTQMIAELVTVEEELQKALSEKLTEQNELAAKFRVEMKEKSALEELKANNATYIDKLQRSLFEQEKHAAQAADTIRNLQNVFFALQDANASTIGELDRAKEDIAANLKQISELQSKLAYDSSARAELSAALEELQAELDGVRYTSAEEIESLQHELQIMQHIRQEQEIEIDKLRQALIKASSEQEQLGAHLQDEQQHRNALEEDNVSHLTAIDKLTLLVSEHTATIASLQKDFSNLIYSHNKDLKHLKEQSALAAKENGRLTDENAAFRNQVSDLHGDLAQLEKNRVQECKVMGEQQALSAIEIGRLADRNAALGIQVSQLEETLTRLETESAEDTKRAVEKQRLSNLQIERFQDETSSLRKDVSDWEGRAAELEEKMAVDAVARAALMANLDELRHELESLTSTSIQDKEAMQTQIETLRLKVSELAAAEEELQKALSEQQTEQRELKSKLDSMQQRAWSAEEDNKSHTTLIKRLETVITDHETHAASAACTISDLQRDLSTVSEQYAIATAEIFARVAQISHLQTEEASLRGKLLEDAAARAQLLTDMNELRGELDRKKYRIA